MVGRRRLLAQDVEPGPLDPTRAQRLHQRLLVHQLAARRVDQHGRRLHDRQRLGVDQVEEPVEQPPVQHDHAEQDQVEEQQQRQPDHEGRTLSHISAARQRRDEHADAEEAPAHDRQQRRVVGEHAPGHFDAAHQRPGSQRMASVARQVAPGLLNPPRAEGLPRSCPGKEHPC